MGNYQFKVVDETGEKRDGTLTARSFEEARAALQERSFTILDLKEHSLAAPFTDDAPNPGRRIWIAASATISLLLFLSIAATILQRNQTPRKPKKAPVEAVTLTVLGKLETLPVHDVTIHVVLPELPLETEMPLDRHSPEFELSVTANSVTKPNKVVLELSQDGQRWQAGKRTGTGLSGTVDFGVIPYSPPKLRTRRHRKPRRAYQRSANPKAEMARNKAERQRQREQWRRESYGR